MSVDSVFIVSVIPVTTSVSEVRSSLTGSIEIPSNITFPIVCFCGNLLFLKKNSMPESLSAFFLFFSVTHIVLF